MKIIGLCLIVTVVFGLLAYILHPKQPNGKVEIGKVYQLKDLA